MRLLDRLILKDLIGPFINGFLMFMMLVFAAGSLFQATEWIVQGIPTMIVLKLVLFSIPSLVTQVLPMAMLLAGLLGFGRLSADREIVAIFAAGIAFPRTARIVLIMGALVSIVAYAWNDTVVPAASTAFWDLKVETFKHIGKEDKPLFRTIDRKDNKGVEEAVSVNGGYDAKTHVFRRVNILKFDDKRPGQPLVNIYCDQVRFLDERGANANYEHGYFTLYRPDAKTGLVDGVTVSFDTLKLLPYGASIGKSFEEVLKSDVTDPNRKSFRDLKVDIQAARAAGEDVRGRMVDLYGKISLPFASFIFGIVGAALGCNTQRGGGKTVGFGTAIFIVFLYWVFYHAMFVVGKNGGLPPIVASFLADIVGAFVGVALAARASR
ncbi:MAG: putative permease [Chthonomonadaceae bacterium]|nr:putative permease [Chthonomonadaceae bacterium]